MRMVAYALLVAVGFAAGWIASEHWFESRTRKETTPLQYICARMRELYVYRNAITDDARGREEILRLQEDCEAALRLP